MFEKASIIDDAGLLFSIDYVVNEVMQLDCEKACHKS